MIKKILAILVVMILVGCSNGSNVPEKGAYQKISPEEAKEMMGGNVVILDVRTQEEYGEGHIENAMLIPVDLLEAKASKSLSDKEATILVYCRSGNRSKRAADILLDLGYTNVYDFGGINTWGDPLVK